MALTFLPDLALNAETHGPVGGPPVVLLHALGTSLRIWDEVIPLLPPTCRILARPWAIAHAARPLCDGRADP